MMRPKNAPKFKKVVKLQRPDESELTLEEKAKEREKLMKEFLAKGGKVEKVPYGVTNQEMGMSNQNAGWIPPTQITPKTWRSKKTKDSNKSKKSKKSSN